MSNSWEVVGNKSQKKSKIPQHAASKGKKKFDPNSMPRIDTAAPVKESATIYDAFIEKQPNQTRASKEAVKPVGNGTVTQRKTAIPKKKTDKNQEKKANKVTLEDAAKEISVEDLEAVLVRDQVTFPDNRALWLMDMASLINLKLDAVAEGDPVLEGKPNDYPLCLLSQASKKLICSVMKQCSSSKLEGLMEQCINHMVIDMGKGISTHGYRMFIQLLAKENPEIITNAVPKYIDMIKNNQNRHLRCLSIMWAVGQVGQKDFKIGIQVWLNVMLPFLNIRALAGYIVDYLEKLFASNKNLDAVAGCITERQFFHIFDIVHDPQVINLPGNLQKKLLALYPKFKMISLKSGPDGLNKVFFPSFLKRCEPTCKESQKKELLDCLVICLTENKFNYSQWRQMYTKFMPQSSVLLNHLSENWNSIRSKLDKKLLRETIKAFSLTNEDLSKKRKNNPDCDQACKDVTAKLNSGGFQWFWLFFFFFSIFAGIIAYDVYLHKTFKASKTRKILSDTGMLVILEQAWSRIVLYSGKAWTWLSANVPVYYSKMCEFVTPYLIIFWEKLWLFGVFLVEVTDPARNWLAEKVPIVLDWVNEQLPWIWSHLSYVLNITVEFVVKYSLIIWDFVTHYSFIAGTWLQENVFTGSWSIENIQKLLLAWLEALRTFIQYCGIKIANVFSGVNKS